MKRSRRSDPTLVARLEDVLNAEAAVGFAGAVRVQRQNTLLIDAAVGSICGEPMRATSRFWIASIGKQFASAALFACQDRRLLDIDDPLSRFLPASPPDKRGITLRQILAHLSGLPQSYASESAANRVEAVASILEQPLLAAPGPRFIYSNDNYQLAAAILEIVAGQPYRAFVRTELLAPAGLENSGLVQAGQDATVAPTLHALPERLSRPRWGQQGWYATTGDLARWYQALRSGKILSERSLAGMFEPLAPIQEGHATPGWFVGKTSGGELCHFVRGNEDFGANGLLYAYPATEMVVVVLSHAGDKNAQVSYSRALHSAIEGVLFSD
jgi:CubicO group peptidase (beta-lactamase class C family)